MKMNRKPVVYGVVIAVALTSLIGNNAAYHAIASEVEDEGRDRDSTEAFEISQQRKSNIKNDIKARGVVYLDPTANLLRTAESGSKNRGKIGAQYFWDDLWSAIRAEAKRSYLAKEDEKHGNSTVEEPDVDQLPQPSVQKILRKLVSVFSTKNGVLVVPQRSALKSRLRDAESGTDEEQTRKVPNAKSVKGDIDKALRRVAENQDLRRLKPIHIGIKGRQYAKKLADDMIQKGHHPPSLKTIHQVMWDKYLIAEWAGVLASRANAETARGSQAIQKIVEFVAQRASDAHRVERKKVSLPKHAKAISRRAFMLLKRAERTLPILSAEKNDFQAQQAAYIKWLNGEQGELAPKSLRADHIKFIQALDRWLMRQKNAGKFNLSPKEEAGRRLSRLLTDLAFRVRMASPEIEAKQRREIARVKYAAMKRLMNRKIERNEDRDSQEDLQNVQGKPTNARKVVDILWEVRSKSKTHSLFKHIGERMGNKIVAKHSKALLKAPPNREVQEALTRIRQILKGTGNEAGTDADSETSKSDGHQNGGHQNGDGA